MPQLEEALVAAEEAEEDRQHLLLVGAVLLAAAKLGDAAEALLDDATPQNAKVLRETHRDYDRAILALEEGGG
jgi:hypothetical protein